MYGPECSSTELRIFNAMSSRVQLLAAASVEALHLVRQHGDLVRAGEARQAQAAALWQHARCGACGGILRSVRRAAAGWQDEARGTTMCCVDGSRVGSGGRCECTARATPIGAVTGCVE